MGRFDYLRQGNRFDYLKDPKKDPDPTLFSHLGDWLAERKKVYEEGVQSGAIPRDPYSDVERNVEKGVVGIGRSLMGAAEVTKGLVGDVVEKGVELLPGEHPKLKRLLTAPYRVPAATFGMVAKKLGERQQALTTEDERAGLFERLKNDPVRQVPNFLAEQLPQLVGTILAGGGLAGAGAKGATFLPSFVQAAGGLYRDLVESGADEAQSRRLAVGAGTAIAFLDRLPIDHFLRGAPKRVVVKAFQLALSEGGTESAQEVPTILAEVAAGVKDGKYRDWDQGLQDRFSMKRLAEAGVGGALVGGAIGGFGGTAGQEAPVGSPDHLASQEGMVQRQPEEVLASYEAKHFAPAEAKATKGIRDWGQDLYQRLFNAQSPIEFSRGMTYAIDQARGSRDLATNPIERGVFVKRADGSGYDRVARSLNEILHGVDRDHLRVLLVAEQDLELTRQDKPGVDALGSTEALAALRQQLGEDGYKSLQDTATEWRDWMVKSTLDPLVEAGIITPEARARMMLKNEFFAPMIKVLEAVDAESGGIENLDVGGIRPKKKEQKLGGGPIPQRRHTSFGPDGEGKIRDPLEVGFERSISTNLFVEKQRLYQTFVKELRSNPELAEALGVKEIQRKARPVAFIPDEEGGGEVIYRPPTEQPANSFSTYENGEKVYHSADPRVLAALDLFSYKDINVVMRALHGFTSTVRAGSVLAPIFQIGNLAKDQLEAWVYSPGSLTSASSYIPGISAVKAAGEMIGNSKLYQEFFASGTGNATFVSPDKLSLQSYFREQVHGKKGLQRVNVVRGLRHASDTLETVTRFGIYRRARTAGLSIEEARHAARDATVDFRRAGINGAQINRYVSFFNASYQGLDKLARYHAVDLVKGIKGDQAAMKRWRDSTTKAMVLLTLPSIGLWLLNHDDEDYQELPDWERDSFWHLGKVSSKTLGNIPGVGLLFRRVPGKEDEYWVRYPKPHDVGWIFGSMPERALDYAFEYHPGQIGELFASMERNVIPPGIPTSFGNIVEALPDAIMPVVENITNHSFFFDRPIVPRGTEAVPELQVNERTSKTIQKVSELLQKVPFAPAQLRSPAQFENLVYGWTSTLGRSALGMTDMAIEGQRPGPPAEPAKMFPFAKFMRRVPTGTNTNSARRFYELSTALDQQSARLNLYQKQGLAEKVDRIRMEHPEVWIAKEIRKLRLEMSNLQKERVLVQHMDWTEEEKRIRTDQIDAHLLAVAQYGLEAIEGWRRR